MSFEQSESAGSPPIRHRSFVVHSHLLNPNNIRASTTLSRLSHLYRDEQVTYMTTSRGALLTVSLELPDASISPPHNKLSQDMDRGRRPSSAAAKSLLSRQLASITDTLARASQRRDEEVKRARRSSRASTKATEFTTTFKSTAPAPVMQQEHLHLAAAAPLHFCDGAHDGENADPPSYTRVDETAKRTKNKLEAFRCMMAEVDAEELRREEEEDNRSDVHQRWADAIQDADDAVSIDLQGAIHSQNTPSMTDSQSSTSENDLNTMLAELRSLGASARHARFEVNSEYDGRNDIRQMLAELETLTNSATTDHIVSAEGDPEKGERVTTAIGNTGVAVQNSNIILATPSQWKQTHRGKRAGHEFNDSSFIKAESNDNVSDPRRMLAELAALSVLDPQGHSPSSNVSFEWDEEDDSDIEILKSRLQSLRSSSPDHSHFDEGLDRTPRHKIVRSQATPLHPNIIPYVVALQMEQSNTQWDLVQGWTTCLYGSGMNSYVAQKDREAAVTKAEVALEKIIDSVMEVEEGFRRKEEQAKLYRRLVVSNLAAGADEEALERVFRKYRNDMSVTLDHTVCLILIIIVPTLPSCQIGIRLSVLKPPTSIWPAERPRSKRHTLQVRSTV